MKFILHISFILFYFFSGQTSFSRSPASTVPDIECFQLIERISKNRYNHRRKKKLAKKLRSILIDIDSLSRKVYLYKNGHNYKMKDLVRFNNDIIERISKIIRRSSVDIEILESTFDDNGTQYSYKLIDLEDLEDLRESRSKTLKKMSRFLERGHVKELHIDLLGNFHAQSGGYFSPSEEKISLSKRIVTRIFKKDLPGFVTKHETMHAIFKVMAKNLIDSIYHTQFIAIKKGKLYHEGIYDKYISFEELYNYANNIFWTFSPIRNRNELKYFLKFEIESMLNTHSFLIDQVEVISDQIQKLSEKSTKRFSKLRTSTRLQYRDNWVKIRGKTYFEVENDQIITSRFIPPQFVDLPNDIEAFFKFLEDKGIKNALNEKNELVIENIPENLRDKIVKQYNSFIDRENKLYKMLNEKDLKIMKISIELIKRVPQLKEELKLFIASYVDLANGKITPEKFIEKYNHYKSVMRKLGTSVRENYKGFIPNNPKP